MPVDIRNFFGKTGTAASSKKSSSAAAVAAKTTTSKGRRSHDSAVENDPPETRPSGKGAKGQPAAKSPPRKKAKRLVIDDDDSSTDDGKSNRVNVGGNDVDSDDEEEEFPGEVKAAANSRKLPAKGVDKKTSGATAFKDSKRTVVEARKRTEISVDDFFGEEATAKPTPKARSPDRRRKGRVFDDLGDDDDDEDGDNNNEDDDDDFEVEEVRAPSPKRAMAVSRNPATPTKRSPAKAKSPASVKKEPERPMPPSEPYTGTKRLTSEDLWPGCLNGVAFCFSGVLETLSRDASTELVKELGGRVTTAVSGKTDYLVVGPLLEDGRPYTDGSKYKKAASQTGGRTCVVLGEPLFFGLLLQHDAKARARAGEPPRTEVVPEPAVESSSPPSPPASALKPPPPAAKPVVNPYAATKAIKSNPYAAKKAPPPSSPAAPLAKANLKSDSGTAATAAATNGMLWVDKHKPTDTKQILGNQDCASKLSAWLRTWEAKFNVPGAVGKSFGGKQGPWKAALLSGPPGIGKTTTAHLVAREAGRDVIEFNASDVRSKAALQVGLGDITGSRTIEFNVSKPGRGAGTSQPRTKRCIIMDEVDGMGGGDRGGIASLIQLIKNSHVPIICICNDRQAQKIRSLVDYCMDLRFRRPTKTQLAKRAVEIAAREGLVVEPNAAEAIAESCGNDVRQVLNALQMWSKSSSSGGGENGGSRMTYKQLKDRQHEINKDEILRLGLFDAARTILEGRKGLGNSDPKAERDHLFKRDDAFYVDYNFVGLMVQQNYLRVVQNDFSQTVRNKDDAEGVKVLERMSAAADSMSDFDLVSTTIMRSQNWTLLPFSSICTVKAGFHASGPTGGFLPGYPEFTSYLGRNSTKTKKSRLLQEIQYHANYRVSGGTHELRMTYLPAFRDRFLALLKGAAGATTESSSSDAVKETIDLMDEYGLDRDDVMEKFDEFSLDPKADTFAKLDSKKKAAFTRAYNERAHMSQALVSEQLGTMKKSKRGTGSSSMSETKDLDVIDEDEAVEEDDEPVDNDDDDDEKIRNLFKPSRKGKGAAASKSGASKSATNGKGGRGKANR